MSFHPPQGPWTCPSIQPDKMMENRVPRAKVKKVTTLKELSSVFTSYLLNICKENWPDSFVFIPFTNISQSICPLQKQKKTKKKKKSLADSCLAINISLLQTTSPFLVTICWYLSPLNSPFFIFYFFINLFIYLIFGYVGSLLLHAGFL